MAGKPGRARLKLWRGTHYLFFTDYRTGKQHRQTCESLGAFTATQRKDLEREYRLKEQNEAANTVVRGGRVSGQASLTEDIQAYLLDCRSRVSTRQANPDVRLGLSPKSLISIEGTILHFLTWLGSNRPNGMKTMDLQPADLTAYLGLLVGETTRHGNRKTKRSAATVNLYIRNLRACLRWISRLMPRRFLDFEALGQSLRPVGGKQRQPVAYSPEELQAFLMAALELEDPKRAVPVKHVPGKRARQKYLQPASARSATPVSRLMILLALSGARLGEALTLRWKDLDVDRGRLTIFAPKTGRSRWLSLRGAPEGDVAPRFAKLLQHWWSEAVAAGATADDFVLPHAGFPAPMFPKTGWQATVNKADTQRIGPQKLRQNFTSYAASLGINPAVTALWQGHSLVIASKHYVAQALDRNKNAKDFEEAMGLDGILDELLKAHGRSKDNPVTPSAR